MISFFENFFLHSGAPLNGFITQPYLANVLKILFTVDLLMNKILEISAEL